MKTKGLFYRFIFILILLAASASSGITDANSFGQTVSESVSVSGEEMDGAVKIQNEKDSKGV